MKIMMKIPFLPFRFLLLSPPLPLSFSLSFSLSSSLSLSSLLSFSPSFPFSLLHFPLSFSLSPLFPLTKKRDVFFWIGVGSRTLERAWDLLCVTERRATRPNGEWGYSEPEAVSPKRGVVLTENQSSIDD